MAFIKALYWVHIPWLYFWLMYHWVASTFKVDFMQDLTKSDQVSKDGPQKTKNINVEATLSVFDARSSRFLRSGFSVTHHRSVLADNTSAWSSYWSVVQHKLFLKETKLRLHLHGKLQKHFPLDYRPEDEWDTSTTDVFIFSLLVKNWFKSNESIQTKRNERLILSKL